MKFIYLFLASGLFVLSGCKEESIIELPLTQKLGYNHFNPSFGGLFYTQQNENNLAGVPDEWDNVNFGEIETNPYQSVYQDYVLGEISKERYESIQKSWQWTPDTLTLSKNPLKTAFAFAFTRNSLENIYMVVDANNNQDLSDDKIFMPKKISELSNDTLVLKNAIDVSYEAYVNQKIHSLTTPLLVVTLSENNPWYNFPRYLTTNFKDEKIDVNPGFTSLSYETPRITLISDSLNTGDKIVGGSLIAKNEFIEIKDELYKFIEVNMANNSLTLEKIALSKSEIQSSAIGFKSFSVEGNDVTTKSPIKLDDLKGKYVFLDFWATWCGPCIGEFPTLKKLYGKTNRENFEIIGVVGESTLDNVKKIIARDSVTWPQILSSDTNQIVEKFGVNGYPTTFLLNPDGVIISKNIRGFELEEKLNSLGLLNE